MSSMSNSGKRIEIDRVEGFNWASLTDLALRQSRYSRAKS